MKVYEQDNTVILEDIKDFNPKHIFECGQCFRWIKEDDESYTGVAKGRVINVSKQGDKVFLKNTNLDDFNNIWFEYFDLGTDYGKIKDILRNMDEHLEKATEFGEGIRILKQDGWEMLISFIISSNNRIPMIQKAINNLSREFGTYIGEYNGKEYYAFPTPEELVKATEEELRALGMGYRARYLVETSRSICQGEISLEKIQSMRYYGRARKELLKLSGVGEKVADCICLFALHHMDAFPVDTHIKQVLDAHYRRGFPNRRYRGMRGIMQQYIFYYELIK